MLEIYLKHLEDSYIVTYEQSGRGEMEVFADYETAHDFARHMLISQEESMLFDQVLDRRTWLVVSDLIDKSQHSRTTK